MAGRIDPHEGREIALLQSGEKRIAWFSEIEFAPEEQAAPLLRSGELKREVWTWEGSPTLGVVYYIPGSEAEVAELKTLTTGWLSSGIDANTADVRVGQILGYSAEDIAAFLENKKRVEIEPAVVRFGALLEAAKKRR